MYNISIEIISSVIHHNHSHSPSYVICMASPGHSIFICKASLVGSFHLASPHPWNWFDWKVIISAPLIQPTRQKDKSFKASFKQNKLFRECVITYCRGSSHNCPSWIIFEVFSLLLCFPMPYVFSLLLFLTSLTDKLYVFMPQHQELSLALLIIHHWCTWLRIVEVPRNYVSPHRIISFWKVAHEQGLLVTTQWKIGSLVD